MPYNCPYWCAIAKTNWGGTVCGKAQKNRNECFVSYGGKEHKVTLFKYVIIVPESKPAVQK